MPSDYSPALAPEALTRPGSGGARRRQAISRWQHFVALLLLLPLFASACAPSEMEKQAVTEMTSQMKTWGAGRHLMELPPQWQYRNGEVTLYYGLEKDFKTVEVRILGEHVSRLEFAAAIIDRLNAIKQEKNEKINGSMLIGSWNFQTSGGVYGTKIRYFENTLLADYHRHEIHLLVDDVHVMLRAKSYEGVIAPVEARLERLANQIAKVKEPARTAWGFIFGPVVIRGDHDGEHGIMYFYDPEHRDVWLEVGINSFAPDEGTKLLDRKEQASVFGLTSNDVLHEGKVQIAGMDGQEILMSYQASVRKRQPERKNLLFIAESYRPRPGFTQPAMEIRLSTGGSLHEADEPVATRHIGLRKMPSFVAPQEVESSDPPSGVDSSLTDYEATAVWDAILKSIRLRPSAVAPAIPPSRPISYETDEEIESNRRAMDNFLAGNDFVDPLKPRGSR